MRLFRSAAEKAVRRTERERVERELARYGLQKKFFLYRKKKAVAEALIATRCGVRNPKTGKLMIPRMSKTDRRLQEMGIRTWPDVWMALSRARSRGQDERWRRGQRRLQRQAGQSRR